MPLDKYAGRPSYVVPMNISVDREAREYLASIAGEKNLGRIVSRLILEERARAEERQRMARLLVSDGAMYQAS